MNINKGTFPETTTTDVVDTAQEKAASAVKKGVDKAKEIASTVAHKAEETASFISEKAEQATAAVGSGVQNLAGTCRGLGEDLTHLIQRHPLPALLVGVGIGLLAWQLLKLTETEMPGWLTGQGHARNQRRGHRSRNKRMKRARTSRHPRRSAMARHSQGGME